jgi:hypothetical protein
MTWKEWKDLDKSIIDENTILKIIDVIIIMKISHLKNEYSFTYVGFLSTNDERNVTFYDVTFTGDISQKINIGDTIELTLHFEKWEYGISYKRGDWNFNGFSPDIIKRHG